MTHTFADRFDVIVLVDARDGVAARRPRHVEAGACHAADLGRHGGRDRDEQQLASVSMPTDVTAEIGHRRDAKACARRTARRVGWA